MALKRKSVLEGTFGTEAQQSPMSDRSTNTQSENTTADIASVTEIAPPAAEEDTYEPEPPAATTPPPPPAVDIPAPRTTSPRADTAAPKPRRRVVSSRAEEIQRRDDKRLRTAVEDAYKSAKRRPKEWGTAPIRISADAKERLAQRRGLDEANFGVKFAETHYMDVAIASVPDDPSVAITWVEDYLDTLGLKAPDTVGTTGRLRKETAAEFDTISRKIRTEYGYGKTGHLQTAALLRLLDALDRADEWNQPGVVDLDEG